MTKSTNENPLVADSITVRSRSFAVVIALIAGTAIVSAAPLLWINDKPFGDISGTGRDLVGASIDSTGTHLYVRNRGTLSQPARALKIRTGEDSQLPAIVNAESLNSTEYRAAESFSTENNNHGGNGTAIVLEDGRRFGYLYQSGVLEEYAPRSNEVVCRITVPTGSGRRRAAGCLLVDQKHQYLYIGTANGPSDPAQVVKIAVGDGVEPTRLVGAINLNPDESNIRCGVIDTANHFALFTTDKQVVKVALGDGNALPKRISAIPLPPAEQGLYMALHDPQRPYVYFANKDSIVKVKTGSAADTPQRLGGITLYHGNTSIPWIVGAIVPLVITGFFPKGTISPFARSLFTGIFAASTVVALSHLIILQSRGETNLAASMPPVIVPFFFLLPLCSTLMGAVAKGRRSIEAGGEFWPAFLAVIRHPVIHWSAIWFSFVAALEGFAFFYAGGGNIVISASIISLAASMVFGSLLWVRRCQSLRSLCLCTFVTALPTFLAANALSIAFMALIGAGGYMGLGYLAAPMLATPLIALFCWIVIRRWPESFISEDSF
jgi:hypothetical protein